MEISTSCGVPAARAAWRRLRVPSTSTARPAGLLAQWTIAATPVTALASRPPRTRSPVIHWAATGPLVGRGRRLSTRTSWPAARSRATTARPRMPLPPVTRIGWFVGQDLREEAGQRRVGWARVVGLDGVGFWEVGGPGSSRVGSNAIASLRLEVDLCWKIPGGALTSISVDSSANTTGTPVGEVELRHVGRHFVPRRPARRPAAWSRWWRLVAHRVSRSRRRNPASPAAASPAATTRRIIVADQEMVSRGG
jgi:hypothetical protein